ncbi:MAG TPA: histidine triad nucleotide-binding protein [Acidobacteriota bacterium]|jgi:histidine triad (HIT) family protein|nr:histidine triad nucleotide-binding protein [Acidobacteriota bacterium]
MEDCVFCKITNHSIPSKIVFEDDKIVAFEDIMPQAPTHILIVPRQHISTLNEATEADRDLLGSVVLGAVNVAKDRQLSSSGYRLVWNTNRGAGQSVFHIHLHLLGGRAMAWPPG